MRNAKMHEKKRPVSKRAKIAGIVILAAILLIVAGVEYITDFLWFRELGYISVFFKKLLTQLKIGVPTFIVITFTAYIYFKLIRKNYYEHIISEKLEANRLINWISWGFAAIFGAVVTWYVTSKLWFSALQFVNNTKFGTKDPIFNLDISFYVFKLDFLKDLNILVIIILLVFILLTLGYYAVLMNTRPSGVFERENDGFEERDRFDSATYDFRDTGEQSGTNGVNDGDSGKKRKKNKQFKDRFRGTPFEDLFKTMSSTFSEEVGKKNIRIGRKNVKQLFTIASKQLIAVGIALFVMISINALLKQFDLLHQHRGAVYGAGYTDVTVTLWTYRIITLLGIIGAVSVVVGIKRHKLKWILAVPIAMVVILGASKGIAAVVQSTIVSPNEITKESKYLERNIKYTQKAYGLENVDTKFFPANNDLTKKDIVKNEPTISNIRINDYMPTEKFYNQTQSIRQYYKFNDVDVDRYNINGEYTQTFLSPREIDESKINQTWLNKHLKYTHGYGVTLSRVNAVTASGQPSMIVKNIPSESSAPEVQVKRPQIYYGELTNDYAVTGTKEDEFDYPDGDSNKYSRYNGKGGIKLNMINRLLFAIKEKSFKLLVSSNINSNSKILINRNIKDRVKKIMPYLEYDKEPYMVVDNGKLYWIIDAYTSSKNYPYSEPFKVNGKYVNYVRNSVKVVIDAYNGNVDYYVVDSKDPMASTFKKIYPKLFKDFDKMPEGIRKHIRYPSELFATQAKVYSRYHMNDVRVFYQNEDLWDIAKEIYGTEEKTMTPNYYIMNLPGENKAEFVSTLPYTPKDKKNMTGLLMARNDGENYGKLVLYKMPKNKVVYGPRQIEAQIDQDPEISKEFSLWNSSGSKYSRGNMFVIPIGDSILYVEPVYLEASESSIPEVKRVIVAYGDKIAYEKTLSEALDKLFGQGSGKKRPSGSSPDGDGNSQKDLIKKANDAYKNAIEAQKKGEWGDYGKYMKELEETLKKLK
jgi:UPF0182 protein GCWU000322_00732